MSGDDGLEQCPECQLDYDTDHTSPLKIPVPVSCIKCGGYTICYCCAAALDRNPFKCPSCHKTGCFDKPPVVNVFACRALDQIRSLRLAVTTSGSSSSLPRATRATCAASAQVPRLIKVKKEEEPVADHGGEEQESEDLKMSSVVTPDKQVSSLRLKSDQEAAFDTTITADNGTHRVLTVGEQVYCLWPENGQYYPGKVTRRSQSTNQQVQYSILFDDQDRRTLVHRNEIVAADDDDQQLRR